MSFYISLSNAKKTALVFFLMTQTTISLAVEPTDVVLKTGKAVGSNNVKQQNQYNFPRWPERQRVQKDMIPPPPPGPYMSLALNDFSTNEPSFGSELDNVEEVSNASLAPVEVFSPDRPWPENLRPVKRWVPENGYRYVTPQANNKPQPVTRNAQPANYNYGFNRNPGMDWSGSRWMPSIQSGPAGPYVYQPTVTQDYRNPVNNYVPQPGRAPYRSSYPAQSKP